MRQGNLFHLIQTERPDQGRHATRFRTAFILALLLVGSRVPARAQLPAPRFQGEVKTITAWTHEHVSAREFRVLYKAAATFNQMQHGYRVELVSSLYRNYEQWVFTAALNGTLPCILEFDGPFLYGLAWSGYLQPIERFFPERERKDFLPSIIAQGTYDGQLYSLGQYESGMALWANRRYLLRAGVRIPTLQHPWNLREFEQALRKLQALPGIEHAIDLGAYSASKEFYSYAFGPILQGFGGDLIDRATGTSARTTLAGPEAVTAMEHFREWFANGWASASLDQTAPLLSGKAALAWGGNWMYRQYHKALGEDLLVLPLPDFGRGIKTGVGAWTWGLSSTCRDPDGAGAFLRFLMSREQIDRMASVHSMMASRRSVLERSPLYGPNGPLRLFVSQLDAGLTVPRPATPAYGTIRDEFAAAVSSILAGNDADSRLRQAAGRIDAEIARNHGYPNQ